MVWLATPVVEVGGASISCLCSVETVCEVNCQSSEDQIARCIEEDKVGGGESAQAFKLQLVPASGSISVVAMQVRLFRKVLGAAPNTSHWIPQTQSGEKR